MKAIKSHSDAFIPFAIDLILENIEVVLTRNHSKRITMKRMPPTRIHKESHTPNITSEELAWCRGFYEENHQEKRGEVTEA